ncbi:hypothetical protein DL93DRAFT_2087340 [Clavulina sp. PMI_390]|nr:hypothetical protein DL93DRAFT_2087340 [Clavulina sp. PMI_390]
MRSLDHEQICALVIFYGGLMCLHQNIALAMGLIYNPISLNVGTMKRLSGSRHQNQLSRSYQSSR